jgi:hypothetical protein
MEREEKLEKSRGYKHGQKELVLAEVNTISLN